MSLRKGSTLISGKGSAGADGYSPSASVSQSGSVTTISITDKVGTTTASIDLSNKQDIMQFSTMPTASSSYADKIVQYVGNTDNTYTNGYFYKCTEDNGNYTWESIETSYFSEAVEKASIKFNSGTITDNNVYNEIQRILNLYVANSNIRIPLMTSDGYILNSISSGSSSSANNYRTWYFDFYYIYSATYYTYRITFYTTYTTPYTVYKYNEGHNANISGINNTNYLTSHQSLSNYLAKDNTTAFTPTGDYNPSTKKYVDDTVGAIDLSVYLAKDNTTVYTPTSSYNPCTKLYAEDYANNLFSALNGLSFEVVATLPTTNISTTTIYLQGSASPYTMYVYVNNAWQTLGTTQLDINPQIVTSSTTTYTIATLNGNMVYKLGEIEELTVEALTTFDRESTIYFTSGATPTDISIPDSLVNLGDVPELTNASNMNTGTCEENKSYIISILNNIAVWKAY